MKVHALISTAILVMWSCAEGNFSGDTGDTAKKSSGGSTSKCKPTKQKPCVESNGLSTSGPGSGPGSTDDKKDLDTTVGGQAFTTPTAPCQIWRCKNTVAVKEVFYPTYHEPGCPGTATIDSSTIPHGTSMFKITHKVGHIGYFYAFDPSNEQVNGYDNDALTAPRVTCNNGTMP